VVDDEDTVHDVPATRKSISSNTVQACRVQPVLSWKGTLPVGPESSDLAVTSGSY
jgi:hypothetical protein